VVLLNGAEGAIREFGESDAFGVELIKVLLQGPESDVAERTPFSAI
jgi:hypothetical protein